MPVPHGDARSRRRHIDALSGDAFSHRRLLHRLKAVTQQSLHLGLEHIGPLTHHRTLITREFSHRPEHAGDATFLAEQSNPQLLERSRIGSIGDFRGRLLLQGIQLIGELLQGDRGAHGTVAESD